MEARRGRAVNLPELETPRLILDAGRMEAWDVLAKAAGMPLAVLLGGSVGPVPATTATACG